MSESKAVAAATRPSTKTSLNKDLRALGLKPGTTVIVHCSLSKLGWVCGGPIAVVQALMEVVTSAGTIVMPAHSSGNTDPSRWQNPPVPEGWWPGIREEMPAFDPQITPTAFMGAAAEAFRNFSGVKRSYHPAVSFTAWGKHADFITANHALEISLGDSSPLARIYDLDGQVLLLGAGHDSNTSLHLAESRVGIRYKQEGGAVVENGNRVWKTYRDIDYDSEPFADIGRAFAAEKNVATGNVGAGVAQLMSQRELVDFGVDWIREK